MIHGPKIGYSNGTKNHYRREKYAFVERALGPHSGTHVPRNARRVLLLDEADGRETFFLIAKGYRPENLCVVNYNAAKLAILQGRVRAVTGKSISTYGCDLSRAVDRITHKLDVIHLDYTSNCSNDVCVSTNAAASLLRDGGVAIVNVLKGREMKVFALENEWVDSKTMNCWTLARGIRSHSVLSVNNVERLSRLFSAVSSGRAFVKNRELYCEGCRWHAADFIHGSYQAGPSPMLWIAAHVTSHLAAANKVCLDSDEMAHFIIESGISRSTEFNTRRALEAINGWLNIPSCARLFWSEQMFAAASVMRRRGFTTDRLDAMLSQRESRPEHGVECVDVD